MHPSPILDFSLLGNHFEIHLYGLCIAVGILLCLLVFYLYTSKRGMAKELQDFIFFAAIFAIALGFLIAKLYQAVYDWIGNGFSDFDFYSAGITAMGGFIGGAAVLLFIYFVVGKSYFKGKLKDIHKKQFSLLLNVAPCCITIAHAFGRIGCLNAGCCHGAYLGQNPVAGGIFMEGTTEGWGYYVPTQLYEAIFLFVLFGVLSALYFKRVNVLMAIYLIAYGVWRMIIEFFRTDARGGAVLGLYPSQWQSVVFIVGGLVLILIYALKKIPFKIKDDVKSEKEKVDNK